MRTIYTQSRHKTRTIKLATSAIFILKQMTFCSNRHLQICDDHSTKMSASHKTQLALSHAWLGQKHMHTFSSHTASGRTVPMHITGPAILAEKNLNIAQVTRWVTSLIAGCKWFYERTSTDTVPKKIRFKLSQSASLRTEMRQSTLLIDRSFRQIHTPRSTCIV